MNGENPLKYEFSGAEDAQPIKQLKETSAMLAVLLEDIYGVSPENVKNRICKEIQKINQCIRDAESTAR